jgi:hypothetical protein
LALVVALVVQELEKALAAAEEMDMMVQATVVAQVLLELYTF